jgi:hypothetical protein
MILVYLLIESPNILLLAKTNEDNEDVLYYNYLLYEKNSICYFIYVGAMAASNSRISLKIILTGKYSGTHGSTLITRISTGNGFMTGVNNAWD